MTFDMSTDMTPTPALPDGWTLHECSAGYYARHPQAGQTDDCDTANTASQEAHMKHQKWINNGGAPSANQDDSDASTKTLTPAAGSPAEASGLPTEPIEVFDAESGELVERTPQQQRQAMQLLQMLKASVIVQSVTLARIMDNRHYLDYGCSSFKELVQTEMGGLMSYRQAKKYVAIGRPVNRMLPNLDSSEEATLAMIPEEVESNEQVKDLAGLGVGKLRELSKLDQPHFEEVVSEGKLVMPDEQTEYTLEELKDMKTREFEELAEQARMDRQAYRTRIQELEAEVDKLESEKETNEETVEQAQEKIDKARDLEAQYGKAHETHEGGIRRLEQAIGYAARVRKAVLGDGFTVPADAPDAHKTLMRDLVRELNSIVASCMDEHPGLHSADDPTAFEPTHPIADEVLTDDELDAFEQDAIEMGYADPDTGTASDNDVETVEPVDVDVPDADVDMGMLIEVATGRTKDQLKQLSNNGWMCEPTLDNQFVFTHKPTGTSTGPNKSLAGAANEAWQLSDDL